MESNKPDSLFGLVIDPNTKDHLVEVAKWARFLAIVGFVFLSIILLCGVLFAFYMSTVFGRTSNGEVAVENIVEGTFGLGMIFIYGFIALIWFFPLLFLLRFSRQMKHALISNDQQALNVSVQNLKGFFRFIGIVTIIALTFYVLMMVVVLVGQILL